MLGGFNMRAHDLINYNVVTVQSVVPAQKAVSMMKNHQVDELAVLNGKKFVGIVCAREFLDVDLSFSVDRYTNKNCPTVREEEFFEFHPTFSNKLLPVVTEDGIYKGCIAFDQLNALLQQELKQLMLIFNNSYDGMLITDGHGFIIDGNKAFEQMTMLKINEWQGLHMTDLVKKGLFINDSVIMKTLNSGKQYTNMQKYKRTGIDTLVTATPIKNENGDTIRVLANVRDVTELIELQDRLAESTQITNRYESELKTLRFENMKRNEGIIVESQEMQDIMDLVYHVASSDSTMLILGESGTGKEVIARLLHENSDRNKTGSFIKVNCGAIPNTLLESELFGYESGAFTGAKKEGKPGMFELADNGTLFLDEVGELPLDMQVKLLRVLQEQELVRVGGIKTKKIDVRILAATNSNLESMVKKGEFRQDLYYRLNVIPIHLPPLRERKADIVPLLGYFLSKFNEKYGYTKRLSKEVVECLLTYSFPGNIREVSNIVERIVLTCRDNVIESSHLPNNVLKDYAEDKVKTQKSNIQENTDEDELRLSWQTGESDENLFKCLEREVLIKALIKYGSVRKTGKAVGVSHTTILKKMRKFGVTLKDFE